MEKANSSIVTAVKLLPGSECREECKGGIQRKGHKKSLGVIILFTILIVTVVMVSLQCIYIYIIYLSNIYTKTYKHVQFKYMPFIVCQLYISKTTKKFYGSYDFVPLIIRVNQSLQLCLKCSQFHPNDTNHNWKIENSLTAL